MQREEAGSGEKKAAAQGREAEDEGWAQKGERGEEAPAADREETEGGGGAHAAQDRAGGEETAHRSTQAGVTSATVWAVWASQGQQVFYDLSWGMLLCSLKRIALKKGLIHTTVKREFVMLDLLLELFKWVKINAFPCMHVVILLP